MLAILYYKLPGVVELVLLNVPLFLLSPPSSPSLPPLLSFPPTSPSSPHHHLLLSSPSLPPPLPHFPLPLQMNLLLREYLSSGDKDEAVRCLRELEVPHFHHELVYEAVVMVLERASQRCAIMMSDLLQYMAQVTVITSDQIHKVREGSTSLCVKWHP